MPNCNQETKSFSDLPGITFNTIVITLETCSIFPMIFVLSQLMTIQREKDKIYFICQSQSIILSL